MVSSFFQKESIFWLSFKGYVPNFRNVGARPVGWIVLEQRTFSSTGFAPTRSKSNLTASWISSIVRATGHFITLPIHQPPFFSAIFSNCGLLWPVLGRHNAPAAVKELTKRLTFGQLPLQLFALHPLGQLFLKLVTLRPVFF